MRKGTCKHFNGLGSNICTAGVRYDSFTPRGKVPCIAKYRDASTKDCPHFEEPSDEECAAEKAALQAAMDRMTKILPLISEIKRSHKGTSWSGTVTCPVCNGRLHLSHSASNGHVWGRCATPDCVAWME